MKHSSLISSVASLISETRPRYIRAKSQILSQRYKNEIAFSALGISSVNLHRWKWLRFWKTVLNIHANCISFNIACRQCFYYCCGKNKSLIPHYMSMFLFSSWGVKIVDSASAGGYNALIRSLERGHRWKISHFASYGLESCITRKRLQGV